MSKIERLAARALREYWGQDIEFVAPSTVKFIRAILTALREPNEGMLQSGDQAAGVRGVDTLSVWQAMIDHILNEEANG